MNEPKYILRTKEVVFGKSRWEDVTCAIWILWRILAWVNVAVLLFNIIFLKIEHSWSAIGFTLFSVIVTSVFFPKPQPWPSPIELQFYDEYLHIICDEQRFRKGATRKAICDCFYEDIKEIKFCPFCKRFDIIGTREPNKLTDFFLYYKKKNKGFPRSPDYIVAQPPIGEYHFSFTLYGDDADRIISGLEEFTGKEVAIPDEPS